MNIEIDNCNGFYKINETKLNFLAPVIKEWGRMTRKFSEELDDSIFRLNERPNVSLFSSAIWMCGGVAVEEYSSRKGKNKSSGRVDLRFNLGGSEVVCEAKHSWLKIPKLKDKDYIKSLSQELNKTKNSAMSDLNHTLAAIDTKPNFGLALTFFSPYWSMGTPFPIDQLKKLKSELKDLPCAFFVYIENSNETPPYVNSQKESFNSIILVGQIT